MEGGEGGEGLDSGGDGTGFHDEWAGGEADCGACVRDEGGWVGGDGAVGGGGKGGVC